LKALTERFLSNLQQLESQLRTASEQLHHNLINISHPLHVSFRANFEPHWISIRKSQRTISASFHHICITLFQLQWSFDSTLIHNCIIHFIATIREKIVTESISRLANISFCRCYNTIGRITAPWKLNGLFHFSMHSKVFVGIDRIWCGCVGDVDI